MSRRRFLTVLSTLSIAGVASANAAQDPTGAGAAAPTAEAPPKRCVGDPAADPPKAVFQINNIDDADLVLRVAGNYLVAEPAAEIHVVGYSSGIDFMLKQTGSENAKRHAEQMRRLADRGVRFKVCNNTLRARKLAADAVDGSATVVPSAVIEILRLQTQERFAYFRP